MTDKDGLRTQVSTGAQVKPFVGEQDHDSTKDGFSPFSNLPD